MPMDAQGNETGTEGQHTQVDPNVIDGATKVVDDPNAIKAEGEEGQKTEGEKTAEQDPADRDEKGRFKGVQPRIDELTKKRHEAEREAAYWKGVATSATKAPAQPAEAAAPKPKKDDFESYDDFVEALTDFKAKEITKAVVAESESRRGIQTVEQTRKAAWETRQDAVRKDFTDYDDVVSKSEVIIANHVGHELLQSELGPILARHLALNPEVAEKLNNMTPREVVREVARLELSVPKKPVVKEKTPSGAPPPGGTVKAASALPTNLASASMDDYVAQRKKEGAAWVR